MADKGKTIGIIVLLIAFVIGAANSILITGPSILDTDSSTYVIVVMLMLPVMILFSAKEDVKLSASPSNIAYGIAIFIVFLFTMVLSRLGLSFAYISYRIDAFIWPLFIMALVATLFGLGGVKKMKVLLIYALFASPLLLLPLFSLNGVWTNANASFIYAALKALGVPLSKVGNTFSGLAGPAITISTTCVSLGTFVALLMFMAPVAYLYKGGIGNKVLWLIGGFALMLVLNVVRIASVMLASAYYGVSSSVLLFHLFAGQILFYIAVIIMILIGSIFNLHIENIGAHRARKHSSIGIGVITPIALAFLFGALTFILTIQYSNTVNAQALFFSSNSSVAQSALMGKVIASLENANSNIVQLYASNTTLLYSLYNKSSNSTIYALVTLNRRPDSGYIITSNYSAVNGAHAALLANGITLKGAIATAGNTTFVINYFAMPYNAGGRYVTENYELFAPSNEGHKIYACNIGASNGLGDNTEAALYSTLVMRNSSTVFMCAAYYIAKSA